MQSYLLTYQQEYPQEYLAHQNTALSPLMLELVWTHSAIVLDIVKDILTRVRLTETTKEEAFQAALLHDIGTYLCAGFEWVPQQPPSQYPYIQHGFIGESILLKYSCSEKIARTASHHSGVGFSRGEIRQFGLLLPDQDVYPETELEKLITFASKFHSKIPKMRNVEQINQSLKKLGQHKVFGFQKLLKMFGGPPDMEKISQKYDSWQVRFTNQVKNFSKQPHINLQASGMSV